MMEAIEVLARERGVAVDVTCEDRHDEFIAWLMTQESA